MCKAHVQYLISMRVIMLPTPGRNISNVIRHINLSLTKSVKRRRQEGLQERFMTSKVVPSFENCILHSGHATGYCRLIYLSVCARAVKAGDNIEVLKQYLPDGWSLVSAAGQVGLVPETYYTVSGRGIPSSLYFSDHSLWT
jgi:hypothetical protein